MISKEELGQNIRKAIKRKGFKQYELAERIYTSAQEVSGYVNGARQPSLERLVDIADNLDCSVDELLGRDNKPAAPSKEISLNDLMQLIDVLYCKEQLSFEPVEYENDILEEDRYVMQYDELTNEWYEDEEPKTLPGLAIVLKDKVLQSFMSGYQKMSKLKQEGIIDNRLFTEWLDGQKAIYGHLVICHEKKNS